MENVQFPKVLSDVAVLQAKVDALEGLIGNLLQKITPTEANEFMNAYQRLYKKKALENINEIPQIDVAIREDIKRQLGI
jgi:hypothetical protein